MAWHMLATITGPQRALQEMNTRWRDLLGCERFARIKPPHLPVGGGAGTVQAVSFTCSAQIGDALAEKLAEGLREAGLGELLVEAGGPFKSRLLAEHRMGGAA